MFIYYYVLHNHEILINIGLKISVKCIQPDYIDTLQSNGLTITSLWLCWDQDPPIDVPLGLPVPDGRMAEGSGKDDKLHVPL